MKKRTLTRILIATELTAALAYGALTGLGIEGKLVDVLASFVPTIPFVIWLTTDSKSRGIELTKVQKVLFLIVFSAPFLVLWYAIKSRKSRSLIFLGKLVGIAFAMVVASAVSFILISVFVTQRL